VKPIVAAVNGVAYGGGLEMVLNCDIVVASEDAIFGAIETANGLVSVHGGRSILLHEKPLADRSLGLPRMSHAAGHQVVFLNTSIWFTLTEY
jgi:enoyl-CoA hydratase/carnithine racemase